MVTAPDFLFIKVITHLSEFREGFTASVADKSCILDAFGFPRDQEFFRRDVFYLYPSTYDFSGDYNVMCNFQTFRIFGMF